MRRALHSLGALVGLLGVAFVARELVSSWDDVRSASAGADPFQLLVAFLVGTCAMLIIGLGWSQWLAVLGERRPRRAALHWYYVGQLGKYVPGGIWPVVGRGEMARRGRVPPSVGYGSTVLSLGSTYLAALLTVAASLAAGASGGERVPWASVVVLLPVGIIALHPRIVRAAMTALRRVTSRPLIIPIPNWGTSAALLLWHVPAWLAVGTATWLVARALDGASPSFRNILFAAVLSWIIGFLAVPVPGGIGVREVVFVTAATSMSSPGVAAAVAVVARVLFILVDLAGAWASTIWIRWMSAPPRSAT